MAIPTSANYKSPKIAGATPKLHEKDGNEKRKKKKQTQRTETLENQKTIKDLKKMGYQRI